MYARVNSIYGKNDKVEDGVAQVEKSDRGAVEATDGNRGLTTLVDRNAGVIVAISYWDEPARSSEPALTRAREGAVAAAGGHLVAESYEVASQEGVSVPAPGAVLRLMRVQIESARVADGLEFIRDEVLPRLRVGDGFCNAELLIDRRSGNGLLLTAWTAEDNAARLDTVIEQLREEAAERVGAKFPRTETYALVRTSVRAD
jgi:hypothetical protein